MAQERSDVNSGLDPKKMAQYRCVINITWLPLMKHAMLVKKGTCPKGNYDNRILL